jgi:hypothetical protein
MVQQTFMDMLTPLEAEAVIGNEDPSDRVERRANPLGW